MSVAIGSNWWLTRSSFIDGIQSLIWVSVVKNGRSGIRDKKTDFSHKIKTHREKWSWWTYFQGRIRDADVESERVDTAGEGEGGAHWDSSTGLYTLPRVNQPAGGKLLDSTGGQLVLCDDPEGGMCGWEGDLGRRGYMYTCSWFTLFVQQKQIQYCKADFIFVKNVL